MTQVKWVPVGEWCISAQQLINQGLRKQSYPFDWAFSSLRHVIAELEGAYSLLKVFHGTEESPSFVKEKHHLITFPHQEKMKHFEKSVDHWKSLFADQNPGEVIHFLYATREGDTQVKEKLEAFAQKLQEHFHSKKFLIFNVHYETWASHPHREKVNHLRWERFGNIIRAVAHISHAWDGHNWSGIHHQSLWDYFFQEAAKMYPV